MDGCAPNSDGNFIGVLPDLRADQTGFGGGIELVSRDDKRNSGPVDSPMPEVTPPVPRAERDRSPSL